MTSALIAALCLLAFTPPIGTPHRSSEAQVPARPACTMTVSVLHGLKKVSQEEGERLFPEWLEVGRPLPAYGTVEHEPASLVILEGEVAGWRGADEAPYLAHEDVPTSHYTHDFNFDVKPDAAYRNLLGISVKAPCADERAALLAQLKKAGIYERVHRLFRGPPINPVLVKSVGELRARLASPQCQAAAGEEQQKTIEVEWESGLGQANPGNGCAAANQRGESCGFFSAGHKRHDKLWMWPTAGDHVHVEGLWSWDRGHPPARTEIHPPRLVAVRRRLPEVLARTGGSLLATRADIFASGDGSGLVNNRPQGEVPLRRVKMSEKDYSFVLVHPLPPPPGAKLGWSLEKHAGDTFPAEAAVSLVPGGVGVHIVIPWKTRGAQDTAVFARTIHLFWDDARAHGVAATYKPRFFRVAVQGVKVNKTQETLPLDAGEFRVFADLGGQWHFLNEFVPDADLLGGGLGHARRKTYPLSGAGAVVVLPPGDSFRVYASGWEADGTDRSMGHIADPTPKCDASTNAAFSKAANDFLWHGGVDDPIGDIEWWLKPESVARGKPLTVEVPSAGARNKDEITSQLRSETDVFRLQFKVDEIDWP